MRDSGPRRKRSGLRALVWAVTILVALVSGSAGILAVVPSTIWQAKGMNDALVEVETEMARLAAPQSLVEVTVVRLDPSSSTLVVKVKGKKASYRLAALDLSNADADAVTAACPVGKTVWLEVTGSGAWVFEESKPTTSDQALNFALMSLEGAQIHPTNDRYQALVQSIQDALKLVS